MTERETWQYKAIVATRGNQSRLGALVLAIAGKQPKHPPYLFSKGRIDGPLVKAGMVQRNGTVHFDVPVFELDEGIRNLVDLAEALKLGDADTTDILEHFRAWAQMPQEDFQRALRRV